MLPKVRACWEWGGSVQKLKEPRSDSPLEALEMAWPCHHFDLVLPTPRTVREYISVILSYSVCGTCYPGKLNMSINIVAYY